MVLARGACARLLCSSVFLKNSMYGVSFRLLAKACCIASKLDSVTLVSLYSNQVDFAAASDDDALSVLVVMEGPLSLA